MKYLLRERVLENQSLLRRCKQFLNKAFQIKTQEPMEAPFELDDFVSGLSPESLLKLRRVQGRLKTEWASAATMPFMPVQGKAVRWTQALQPVMTVTRPKIRVQLRRLESESTLEKPVPKQTAGSEVRGLDDIFPERITSFFEEKKPRQQAKSVGSVVIDYRIVGKDGSKPMPVEKPVSLEKTMPETVNQVETSSEQLKPRFDESWRQKVRWPVVSQADPQAPINANSQIAVKASEWVNLSKTKTAGKMVESVMAQDEPQAKTSWSAAFWTIMNAKIAEALVQIKPVLAALEEDSYTVPEMLPVQAPTTASRKITMPKRHLPNRILRSKPAKSITSETTMMPTAGMDTRPTLMSPVPIPAMLESEPENRSQTPVKPDVQMETTQPVELPTPRLDATLLVSKRRKPFSQVSQESVSKPIEETVSKANTMVSKQESNPIDYMWRNNQILARSISHLADQYFQQAALEESISY